MGIRKNAFLRDMVRVIIADSVEEMKQFFISEIQPAYVTANGNPDKALQIVLSEPAKYPRLNATIPIGEKLLSDLYDKAVILARRETKQPEDLLKKIREQREPMPREAVSVAVAESIKFFRALQRWSEEGKHVLSTLSPEDKRSINEVFANDNTREGRLKKIYDVMRKAAIKGYFLNFHKISERLGLKSQLRVAESNVLVHKVIFSYMDSLDRGF